MVILRFWSLPVHAVPSCYGSSTNPHSSGSKPCLVLPIHLYLKAIFTISTFMNIFWGSLVSGKGLSVHGLSLVFSQWGRFVHMCTLGNCHRSGSGKLAETQVHYKEAMLLKTLRVSILSQHSRIQVVKAPKWAGCMCVSTRIARN